MQALHQQKTSRSFGPLSVQAEFFGEVSFRQNQASAAEADLNDRGHAAEHAALSECIHFPLQPPLALQRSPERGHRRQLSTVAEETYTPASAAARRALPVLDLAPLTQQQEQYNGPQELYQSTAYTSEATDIRTSATASNFSDAAAQSGGMALRSQQVDYTEANSPGTDGEPPLISFTPPPRQAVAKLAKMFQPGPSRLSNTGKFGPAAGDVAASKHFSPLKHHIKAAHQVPPSPEAAAGSRLAVGSGPRESHLDFFLRDAAAATAKFRYWHDTAQAGLPHSTIALCLHAAGVMLWLTQHELNCLKTKLVITMNRLLSCLPVLLGLQMLQNTTAEVLNVRHHIALPTASCSTLKYKNKPLAYLCQR